MALKYYKVCRVQCLSCGDVLKKINQSKEDNSSRVLYCSCGKVGLDPSASMYRILSFEGTAFVDLSEEWKDE